MRCSCCGIRQREQETSKGGKRKKPLCMTALVAYISELVFESCGDSMMA